VDANPIPRDQESGGIVRVLRINFRRRNVTAKQQQRTRDKDQQQADPYPASQLHES